MKKAITFLMVVMLQLLLIRPAFSLVSADLNEISSSFKAAQLEQSFIAEILSAASRGTFYKIVPDHSKAGFYVRGPMGPVQAEFKQFNGGVIFPINHHRTTAVVVSLDVNSLESDSVLAEGLLKSDSFLDVNAHPIITFTGKELIWISPARAVLKGKLTMHGVARDVAFYVEFQRKGVRRTTNDTMRINATTTINRSRFGMTAFSAVDDKVNLQIQVEVVRVYIDPL